MGRFYTYQVIVTLFSSYHALAFFKPKTSLEKIS